ncbi:unnamed protein product [Coffea canephora]|uniref:Bifunctional inhibitor/plant lipid transfer protein/seed storage helical domain-containing protein n=1 Tax=Coffea canephora TaxID=49390 RepID=A0A068TST2_COFCA|nr:non-specific lipid-transfer protein 2-like [Coffea arabica]CDO98408.1 unnamed protein product [Coffea canephora]
MKASPFNTIGAVLMLLLLVEANVSEAVTCNPNELNPCAGAIGSSSPPSSQCCSKIKEQKPCLCQYVKNPTFKQFVASPSAQKVAKTCGVPIPKC